MTAPPPLPAPTSPTPGAAELESAVRTRQTPDHAGAWISLKKPRTNLVTDTTKCPRILQTARKPRLGRLTWSLKMTLGSRLPPAWQSSCSTAQHLRHSGWLQAWRYLGKRLGVNTAVGSTSRGPAGRRCPVWLGVRSSWQSQVKLGDVGGVAVQPPLHVGPVWHHGAPGLSLGLRLASR